MARREHFDSGRGNPAKWLNGRIMWHASRSVGPEFQGPTHVGSLNAAREIADMDYEERHVHPVLLNGRDFPKRVEDGVVNGARDIEGNPTHHLEEGSTENIDHLMDQGINVPYENEVEDSGSTSYVAPSSNVQTWSHHVTSMPKASSYWKRVAERNELVLADEAGPDDTVFSEEGNGAYVFRKKKDS
jgi:hypothetical protein